MRSTIQQHFEALFLIDSHGDLLYINAPVEPKKCPAPLVYYGIAADEVIFAVRADVPTRDRLRLQDIAKNDASPKGCRALLTAARTVLEEHFVVGTDYSGPTFEFPEDLGAESDCVVVDASNCAVLSGGFDDIIPEIRAVQPCVASLVGGRAAAVCQTVRQTPHAVEAGVLTLEAFRRQGHGCRAVRAWAACVRDEGCKPLYSTWWENEASRGLAASLQMRQYGVDAHVSQAI